LACSTQQLDYAALESLAGFHFRTRRGSALFREYCAGGGLPAGRGINRSGRWL
jgi:hypothetical protein